MDSKYDVAIVGAGPAGLFAALKLIEKRPGLKVILIEKGKRVMERQREEVMNGVGGAGTFSDGKVHFTPVLSMEKMLNFYSRSEYQEFLNEVDQVLTKFGVDVPYYPKDLDRARQLVDTCKKESIHLFIRKTRHIGSDKLPAVIKNFEEYLISQGIELLAEVEVRDLNIENNFCKGVNLVDGRQIVADNTIVAPGRVGAQWLQNIAKNLGLEYNYDKALVGVRVEFPHGIIKEHAELLYETIYLMYTKTFDDAIRTYCPCSRGKVAIENYDGFVCVNGHSNSNYDSENSNFAFLSEIRLTEPVENTIQYAKSIAQLANTIGGGKPILQRLADLRNGRRSTWQRINKSYIKPSLMEVTPGDISMALPGRIVTNIVEGLQMLSRVLPGIDSGHTLLYAPEIKLTSSKIETDKYLETPIKNLYVAGDGAGVSGNITGAAATGIIAALGILNKSTNT